MIEYKNYVHIIRKVFEDNVVAQLDRGQALKKVIIRYEKALLTNLKSKIEFIVQISIFFQAITAFFALNGKRLPVFNFITHRSLFILNFIFKSFLQSESLTVIQLKNIKSWKS